MHNEIVVEGIPHGDSAMARAVSLPPAIAAKLILEGKITGKGVRIPAEKEMYEPVLAEMETFGFSFLTSIQLLITTVLLTMSITGNIGTFLIP